MEPVLKNRFMYFCLLNPLFQEFTASPHVLNEQKPSDPGLIVSSWIQWFLHMYPSNPKDRVNIRLLERSSLLDLLELISLSWIEAWIHGDASNVCCCVHLKLSEISEMCLAPDLVSTLSQLKTKGLQQRPKLTASNLFAVITGRWLLFRFKLHCLYRFREIKPEVMR